MHDINLPGFFNMYALYLILWLDSANIGACWVAFWVSCSFYLPTYLSIYILTYKNREKYSLYFNKHPSDQLEISYVHFYYHILFSSFPVHFFYYIATCIPHSLKHLEFFYTFQMYMKGTVWHVLFCNLLLSFKMNGYDLGPSLNS